MALTELIPRQNHARGALLSTGVCGGDRQRRAGNMPGACWECAGTALGRAPLPAGGGEHA